MRGGIFAPRCRMSVAFYHHMFLLVKSKISGSPFALRSLTKISGCLFALRTMFGHNIQILPICFAFIPAMDQTLTHHRGCAHGRFLCFSSPVDPSLYKQKLLCPHFSSRIFYSHYLELFSQPTCLADGEEAISFCQCQRQQ